MRGKTFREYRRFLGFTIKEIASIFGVTEKTINNWESGNTEVPDSGFDFFRKQKNDLEQCLLFFHSETSRKYIPYCLSMNDLYYFYPEMIPVKNLIHQIYTHAILSYAFNMSKNICELTIQNYKIWLQAFQLFEDTPDTRAQYRGFLSSGGEIKQNKPKINSRLVQSSLLEK